MKHYKHNTITIFVFEILLIEISNIFAFSLYFVLLTCQLKLSDGLTFIFDKILNMNIELVTV